MKRCKYHFMQIQRLANGKYLLTLPGQVLGRTPVTPGILVKDTKDGTIVKHSKKTSEEGDIFFTTTLKKTRCCYTATDLYPLREHGNVLFSDVEDEYNKLQQPKREARKTLKNRNHGHLQNQLRPGDAFRQRSC